MMIKIKYAFAFLIIVLGLTVSCKKDDNGPDVIPPHDRGEEAIKAQAEIEEFLETHFYNYEEFDTPPLDFDYKIKFGVIADSNATKTPLIEQVSFKEVRDRIDTDVTYKMYYLKVREGEGDSPHFSDAITTNYNGLLFNLESFDSSVVPANLDLTQTVVGFGEAFVEFKGASSIVSNPDGTLSFEGYGIGAVFIPSGLGYYQYPPGNTDIEAYGQIIFTFQLFDAEVLDHDGDGIPSYMEDLNNNSNVNDDNTDGDGASNYADADDDGDGRLTENEIVVNEDGSITFPDKDGDGVVDYLDKDN